MFKDSGQIGYTYVTKEQIRKEYSVKRISLKLKEQISSILQSEIETLDQYLIGDVYGFTIEYDNGEINSCWGFYGSNPETNGMFEYWTDEEIQYYKENYK